MRHRMFFLACSCIGFAATAARPETPVTRGAQVIQTFDYHGVALEPGLLRNQVDEVKRAYLAVADDDYLLGFRRRAGLPAPGHELGGWYAADRFIPFGQVLSGLARMYAATGDPICREKLNHLVSEWGKCIEPDGYFFYSRHPNVRHYGYEKMVCGLVDAFVYAGNHEAVVLLGRITTWAERNLDRSRPYAYNGPADPGEWYTLSENLYRAYVATGDRRYLEFGRVWEYDRFWRLIREGASFYGEAPVHHAYSHINSLNGAAMAYRITGDASYLDTIVKGYDFLQRHQVYATGGYGPAEHLLPANELRDALDELPNENHCETQCDSWAAFKLAKALLVDTGEARYGDWIERLVLNATTASLPVSATGEATYYAHYGLSGGTYNYSTGPWTCCSGTRIQAVADYHDLIFFRGPDALYVNLYTPARCSWQVGDTSVSITQSSEAALTGKAEFRVGVERPARFALRLRAPRWVAGTPTLTVNGQAMPTEVNHAGWFEVQREWHDGDRVRLTLPRALRAERFPLASAQPFPAAITYGPLVIAAQGAGSNPARTIDWENLPSCLHADANDPVVFHLEGSGLEFRPFYRYQDRQPYYVYFDPARSWTRISREGVKSYGGWKAGPNGLMTNREPTAALEFSFDGTAVRWVARRFDDAGIADVFIDGQAAARIDLYGPQRGKPFQWDKRDLARGKHVVRIVNHPDHNPASRDRYINFLRFEVILAD